VFALGFGNIILKKLKGTLPLGLKVIPVLDGVLTEFSTKHMKMLQESASHTKIALVSQFSYIAA